jgi:hypothetical protein
MTHQTEVSTQAGATDYRRRAHQTLAGAERLVRLWGSLIEEFPATALNPEQLELLLAVRTSIWDQAMSDHEAAAALFGEVQA